MIVTTATLIKALSKLPSDTVVFWAGYADRSPLTDSNHPFKVCVSGGVTTLYIDDGEAFHDIKWVSLEFDRVTHKEET